MKNESKLDDDNKMKSKPTDSRQLSTTVDPSWTAPTQLRVLPWSWGLYTELQASSFELRAGAPLKHMAFAWLPINLRLINSIWSFALFFLLCHLYRLRLGVQVPPWYHPCFNLLAHFGFVWQIIGHWFCAPIEPPSSTCLAPKTKNKRVHPMANWRLCTLEWEPQYSALFLITINYSNCIWSDQLWVCPQLSRVLNCNL